MEPNQPDPNESELKKACDEIQAKREADEKAREERRAEHQKKAEDAMRARSETLRKLREIGPGLSVPTDIKPHLCAVKRGKNDKEAPEHGVQFRRDGRDCLVEAQNGIDTDQEMQELLLIEKNYAANAKVIQAVADMIDTLIRLDG